MKPFVRWLGIAALVVASMGCSMNARLRRSADEAQARHLEGLRSPQAAATYFVLPPGAAWNAALAVLRRRPGIDGADPSTWTIRVRPRFETTMAEEGRVAVQTATSANVGMAMPAAGTYTFLASFATESRQRAVCGEPTAWQTVTAETIPGLEASAASGVRERLERLTWPEVAFRPSEEFATQLAAALAPYTIATSESDTFTTAWRETVYTGRRVTVRTRSRLSIRRLVAVDGTSRFEVGAELQHQGDREKETSAWILADASQVGAHGWAALERVAAPVTTTLADETPEEVVPSVTVAPELEAPTDPGIGTYDFVFSLVVPPHRNGAFVSLDLEVAQATAQGGTSFVPWMQLPVVQAVGTASFQPVRQELTGQALSIQWKAFDKDAPDDTPIAVGFIDLLDVARTCGPVSSRGSGGLELRALAVRSGAP